jgi:hypothetical protein
MRTTTSVRVAWIAHSKIIQVSRRITVAIQIINRYVHSSSPAIATYAPDLRIADATEVTFVR